ncbi:MAG: peptidylprolyl isomerase [Mycobacteriaceae bacterium]|uniref:peptidylprolyl isomerase n=1 Tax=Corynebacterium sp. TaxID=1720 RepID=UPI003F9C0E0C
MSDNSSRRDAALKNLDKELKSRSRREKMRPLGVTLATLVVLVALVGGIWFAATRGSDGDETTAQETSEPETSGPYTATGDAAKEVSLPDGEDIPEDGTTDVTLDTSKGEIGLTLDHAQAPNAAHSFEHLVSESFYDDTVCHRVVVSDGMKVLQCGDPSGEGAGGPGYSFGDEFPVNAEDAPEAPYTRGTLAMANSGPDTNGSQFFLVDDDSELPPDYTVFGSISEDGMETLDSIIEENEDANQDNGGDGPPTDEVRIETAEVD